MIAGLVVTVPFTDRNVCLPLLVRLHLPGTSASKPAQARELVGLLAAAFPDRWVHVVADAAYKGPAWRALPASVTFTTRLASNAGCTPRPHHGPAAGDGRRSRGPGWAPRPSWPPPPPGPRSR